MADYPAADLCRVTLVAARGRFDVALPTQVPLAYLLPTLLKQSGEGQIEAGTAHGGWMLQRLGGWPLDSGQSPASLGLVDGELLFLRPRNRELPPPVFDDVVEAISWTLGERTQRWGAAHGRAAGLVAMGAGLAAGAIALLLSGPPWPLPSVAAGFATLLLLVAAGSLARRAGDAAAAAVVGCAAIGYAGLTAALGLLSAAAPGKFGAPQLIAAASAALIAVVLVAFTVGGGEPALAGAALAVAAVFVGSVSAARISPAAVAAVAVSVVFLLAPFVPSMAYRMARLPAPFLPGTAEELRSADTTAPGIEVAERSMVADRYVTALVVGTSVVLVGAVPVLLASGGWAGAALACTAAALMALRSRVYSGRAQRGSMLAVAVLSAAAGIVAGTRALPAGPPRVAVPVAVVLAVLLGAGLLRRIGRRSAPPAARALDMLEVVAALATIPLVLQVLGVYAMIRSLAG